VDGGRRIVPIGDPPPSEYFVAALRPVVVVPSQNPPSGVCPPHRRFRLSGQSSEVSWWRVYDDGRSVTLERAAIYVEQAPQGE
jgi:hypothetical protein